MNNKKMQFMLVNNLLIQIIDLVIDLENVNKFILHNNVLINNITDFLTLNRSE